MRISINRALVVSTILVVVVAAGIFLGQRNLFEKSPLEVTREPDSIEDEIFGDETRQEVSEEIISAIEALESDEESNKIWSPKVQLLAEILESRNDNDPRLDSELKQLSPAEKREFQEFYRSLQWEDRNGRGTTVFLLGRNISSEEDLEFFVEVLSEPPCLSLTNCDYAEAKEATEHDDHDQTQEVSLAYPQVVALKSLEREWPKKTKLQEAFLEAATVATENANVRVSRMALSILGRWNP